MNLIEKIIVNHSDEEFVKPGDVVDIHIDTRIARDFGGANVIKNLVNNGLSIKDPSKTYFTFDCNPGGSDQKYTANQHYCRQFARENNIKVFDIDAGIGTHITIDHGLVLPGGTFISTDSHANIVGAIGALGQGMGDQDIASAWANGTSWFKVPESIKINLIGKRKKNVHAKDIILNLLSIFGANKLLGYSIEIYGEETINFTLDERITISSMATEMGAIAIFFTPSEKIINTFECLFDQNINTIFADKDAQYLNVFDINLDKFSPMVAKPGQPHCGVNVSEFYKTMIDSAFIGSCTNGRLEDLQIVAEILAGKKIAPDVVLKIVPATNAIWNQALKEGLIKIFKDSGALVSNAGCAGCGSGQIGQNGPGEVTISTGNRNFKGKQGRGDVFLASPATVAASAVAGHITTMDDIPDTPSVYVKKDVKKHKIDFFKKKLVKKSHIVEGRVWLIPKDNIDTDMIFHNKYLAITDIDEMGKYTFDNLEGYEDFANKANKGDIIVTNKNFGAGSSRQQAVDCFVSLGIHCIIAESFGAIYERNAINAAFPILTYDNIDILELKNGDKIKVDFFIGKIINFSNEKTTLIDKFSNVQLKIFEKGGLLA